MLIEFFLYIQNEHPVVFFGSSHWYVFLRLHSILCQRLAAMKTMAEKLAQEEAGDVKLRRPGTAVALRLKPDSVYYLILHICQL